MGQMAEPTSDRSTGGSLPTGQGPPETVFLVDDEPDVLRGMQRLLRGAGYETHTFASPTEALEHVDATTPQVLVTDYYMPSMNGLELIESVHDRNPSVKVILITGAGDERIAQDALRASVVDYLVKPFDAEEFNRVVRGAFLAYARDEYAHRGEARLREEVARQTDLVRSMTLKTLSALLRAQEARTPFFRGHSKAVAQCAVGIARELQLPAEEVSAIRAAGLIHDIGMIAVPDTVVNKSDTLTEEEYAAVRAHPVTGATILEPLDHLGAVRRYVHEHHERLDGAGYPEGKRGDEISLGGQIVGLAEAWTSITEDRAFRSGRSHAEAMGTIAGAGGSWFATDLVEALRAFEAARG